MADIETTEKQPFERFYIWGDFSKVVAEGETMDAENVNTSVTAIDLSDNSDATDEVVDETANEADNVKRYFRSRLKDGVDGGRYKFTIRVETSLGNRWEIDGKLKVDEI